MTLPSLPYGSIRNSKSPSDAGGAFFCICTPDLSDYIPTKVIGSPILGLLGWRSPTAIIGAIGLQVVNSVECHTLRGFAHVSQESRKIVPSRFNRYAPSAVFIVASVARCTTSAFHAFPRSIRATARAKAVSGVTVENVCHMAYYHIRPVSKERIVA